MRAVWLTLLICTSLLASGEFSNRRAPGFALPTPDYSRFYDLQDYRGKVVLIEIMQTTCPHCQLLSTTLEGIKKKFGDSVQIISVVLPPDNASTIAKYISTNKITNPIVCDMGQMTISYLKATPSQSHIDVPHLFLIDKAGMIRNDWSYSDKDKAIFEGSGLFSEVEKLLRQ